jgi:hypothetical protein
VKATELYADRLRRFGRTVTVDIIEGGGHLFDPPYLPLMDMIYVKAFGIFIMAKIFCLVDIYLT